MFHDKEINAAGWVRPGCTNAGARQRAEDVSAQLAAALAMARPALDEGFDLQASVVLSEAEGGGVLHFRCLHDRVLCFHSSARQPLLVTPVAGRVLN